jgi:hypothetical protein
MPLVAARHGRRFLACDGTWRAVHTARLRLVNEAQPFAIRHTAGTAIPAGEADLRLSVEGATVRLQPGSVELDYWEVDPDWDGKTFRSARQARRPNRSVDIPLSLTLPDKPRRLCVRAVTVNGEQIQIRAG